MRSSQVPLKVMIDCVVFNVLYIKYVLPVIHNKIIDNYKKRLFSASKRQLDCLSLCISFQVLFSNDLGSSLAIS